ncbi:MAG TPA: hypothetical protein VFH94_16605 [Streptomyces sp.]|nr:hypothetical protein [Streptomyces sp.]
MQRGLVHGIAWSFATGAAVTLSWWGVHTVMAGTAYDPPQALPIPSEAAQSSTAQGAKPQSSSTRRPDDEPSTKKPKPPASSTGAPRDRKTPPPPSRTPSAPAGSGAGASGSAGTVKSYNTAGGRVVLDMGEKSATLVSATPATGWSIQVWKDPSWIRVQFTGGAATVTVFATWHDHAPSVEIINN